MSLVPITAIFLLRHFLLYFNPFVDKDKAEDFSIKDHYKVTSQHCL